MSPELEEVLKAIAKNGQLRDRCVRTHRFGQDKEYSWQVMERLQAYPNGHSFTDKQKGHLRESILLLYFNKVMGHGDLKADNIMHRGDLASPVLIDLDTVLVKKDTKAHVLLDNMKYDFEDIGDL